MEDFIIYAYLYLIDEKVDILGISQDVNSYEIPIYMNLNFYQLSIINFLSEKKIKEINIFINEDERRFLNYTTHLRENKRINYNIFYEINEESNFKKLLQESIERIAKSDKRNIFILISPLFIKNWLNFKFDNLNKIIYKKDLEEGNFPIYLIELEYFKNILNKISEVKDFKHLANIFKNAKSENLNVEFFNLNLNSLKLYIFNHFKLLEKEGTFQRKFYDYLMTFFENLQVSYLREKGFVRNSMIGTNCDINGQIEDSIIFRDVIVYPGAKIINSIILPGNVIGKDVYLKNAILGLRLNDNNTINIGNKVSIGATSIKDYKNSKYKDILPEGFTLIGNFINLPPGFTIGKNCVITGKVNYSELKKMGRLIDGGTIEF